MKMEELPHEGPASFLISKGLLDECSAPPSDTEWKQSLRSFQDQSFQYPDGSCEIFYDRLSAGQVQDFNRLFQALLHICSKRRLTGGREAGLEGFQTQFRGLWGDPPRLYTMWYPDSVQAGLGDQSLLVMPDAWSQTTQNESDRERLNVSLAMLRRPDESCRRFVMSLVARWFESVAHAGINGEGPVEPTTGFIEWRGRGAFFEANFSRSGQFTLNWLTLWLVAHAGEFPIEFICYGNPDAALLRPIRRSRPVRHQLRFKAPGSGSPRILGKPRVKDVSLQAASTFKADSALLKVSFSDSVSDQQKKHVEDVIDAWLMLGVHGGFSGHFAYQSELEWSPGTDELRFRLDFGTAAVGQALETLERVIRSIDSEVVGVESIVVT